MTIFVTWQLRVTLDSIHNSCDILYQLIENVLSQRRTQSRSLLGFWGHFVSKIPPLPLGCGHGSGVGWGWVCQHTDGNLAHSTLQTRHTTPTVF